MNKNVNQTTLYRDFQIPPSRANIKVTGPLQNVTEVNNKFFQMGLTAADLDPIDWRTKTSLSPIMNQQDCGDCWALSSTSALTDRFIIQKNMKNLSLDPAITAQCAQSESIDQGCGGGQVTAAGQYFETKGIPAVDDNCKAWEKICLGQGNCVPPSCKDLMAMCTNSTYYYAKKGSTQNLTTINDQIIDVNTTVANIKRELVNGPVVAMFFVPNDFMAPALGYKWEATNGIFVNGAYNNDLERFSNQGKRLGVTNSSQWGDIILENGQPAAHAVSIVGWGRGKAGSFGNVSYWIVRNSWGTDWNEGGYFRIVMNDSGLNSNLGFDIPVSILKIASTNQSYPLGGFFGGCVSFDPDLSVNNPSPPGPSPPGPSPPGPSPPGPSPPGPSPSNVDRSGIIIIVVVLSVLVSGMLFYYFWKKSSGKKTRK